MLSIKDFSVGDTVYIRKLARRNAQQKDQVNTLIPTKIVSVGKKYITTTFNPSIKFEVNTYPCYGVCLIEANPNYSAAFLLYKDVESYQSECNRKLLLKEVRDTLNQNDTIPLDCLIKIKEILINEFYTN